MNRKSAPSRKTVLQRLGWLAVLFLAAASLSYPGPINWVVGQVNDLTKLGIPTINKPFVLGLDLQGGTSLEYEADVAKVAPSEQRDAMAGVRDVIERRVNTLGVSEPVVQVTQTNDAWRVNVELAGVRDVNQAIKLIGETPILEFKEKNTDKPRPLTKEEEAEMTKKNADALARAKAILDETRQAGADFAEIAKNKTENSTRKIDGGDTGFLDAATVAGSQDLQDLLDTIGNVTPGLIFPSVVETDNVYLVVKVEESKDGPKEVNAHHLLVSYKGSQGGLSERSKEEAKAKIDELKKQATVANFDSLVAANSDEPNASTTHGDLHWFGPGAMVEKFETPVFAQASGTISEVIESEFGYHLVWKLGERASKEPRLRLIEINKSVPTDYVPVDEWKATALTGKQLQSAKVDFDQQVGTIQVSLQFDDEGSKLFAELTKKHVGEQVAIFLDGDVLSAPVVNQEILGGRAVITGSFTLDEAKLLARRLQAGALPVPITLVAQQSVGPTLGADSVNKSVTAGLWGFLFVALFMIIFYRLPGFVSIVALGLYAAIMAALFKLIPITLTLSGIAGFILSLGIAVDANVLIFERLKEELKLGKALGPALEDAFRRAWPSIRDGHVTVLISCAVLFWFSSSIIKGFALTLGVGMITSLFTAVVTTRTMMRALSTTSLARWGWIFLKKGDS
ncbi:protein translocase subunit SecD [Candidatus Uhrbacteria bacterium]|nr:protein translocase subunit SecD [Candidatus Uhrbacteria bacterium]